MVRRQRPFEAASPSAIDTTTCKCVIVGDHVTGKTTLLKAFGRCHPEDVYYPRREGAVTLHEILIDGKLRTYEAKEIVPDDLLPEYIATAQCNEYHFDGIVNNRSVTLHFWDTPCIDGWTDEETNARESQRAEVYPLADIVLICYSVPCPTSFKHVKDKWYPEVKQYNSEAKIVLLGMKTEHRDNEETKEALRKLGLATVSFDDGGRVAADIGASRYLECTVLDRESVVRVLEALVSLI